MTDETVLPRVAGAFVFLSIAAQFLAIGIGVSHGGGPTQIDFGSDEQLVALNAARNWLIWPLSLAVLSPALAMPVWLGVFHILKRARSYALFGVVMLYLMMAIGIINDVLRLALFVKLPPAYVIASEASKPAMLAFGATLGYTHQLLQLGPFMIGLGLGLPAFALAIFRAKEVPRWLGWTAMVPAVLVGWLGAPMILLGIGGASGEALLLGGMLVLFVWLLSMGVVLLRWQPGS